MSVLGKRGVGMPTLILQEAEGLKVTLELKNGFVYEGILKEADDFMNCELTNVAMTDPKGMKAFMRTIYVRGDQIVFSMIPPILCHAPMFTRVKQAKEGKKMAQGLGRGRSKFRTPMMGMPMGMPRPMR